jgi:hypothetical protein
MMYKPPTFEDLLTQLLRLTPEQRACPIVYIDSWGDIDDWIEVSLKVRNKKTIALPKNHPYFAVWRGLEE